MDALAVIEIFIGGVMAFMGYRLFVDVLRVWGFLIGGIIGVFVTLLLRLPGWINLFAFKLPLADEIVVVTLSMVIGFVVFGALGAVFANRIKVLLAFMIGFGAAYAVGSFLYNMLTGGSNLLLALAFGTVIGLLGVRWEEVVLIIATAFLGSAVFIFGIMGIIPGINNIIATILFFLAGFFGAAAQYRDAHAG
jgi:hypothetical protein